MNTYTIKSSCKKELPPGTILKILELFNVPYKKYSNTIKIHCPFHDDKNPSATVHLNKNTFICFVCGETLYKEWNPDLPPKKALPAKGLFDLLNRKNNKQFLWKSFVKTIFMSNTEMSFCDLDTDNAIEDMSHIWNGFQSLFSHKGVISYLKSRKLDPLKLGEEIRICKEYKKYPLAIPLYDVHRNITGIQLRSLKEKNIIMYPRSKTGIFGIKTFKKLDFAVVCEGSTDYLTLKSLGFDNVIGLFNANMEIDMKLMDFLPQNIIFCGHFDKAGYELYYRFKDRLKNKNIVPLFFTKKPGYDINDAVIDKIDVRSIILKKAREYFDESLSKV